MINSIAYLWRLLVNPTVIAPSRLCVGDRKRPTCSSKNREGYRNLSDVEIHSASIIFII